MDDRTMFDVLNSNIEISLELNGDGKLSASANKMRRFALLRT